MHEAADTTTGPVELLQEPRAWSGKSTPQYERVKTNFSSITGALKSNPSATEILRGKFKGQGWLAPIGKPTEEELVTHALGRIELDPNQYGKFITMLNDVTGLDLIVNMLTGKQDDSFEGSKESREEHKKATGLERSSRASGPSYDQPKLVSWEVDSGHPQSHSVSQQCGYGDELEESNLHPDSPILPPPMAYCDSPSNSHDSTSHSVMPFPPSTQDPDEPDNLQVPSASFLQESQLQSAPPVMIAAGEAVAKLEQEQRKVAELKEQVEHLSTEVLEQAHTKRRFENELKEVRRQLSDKEGKLQKKTTEIKTLKDNMKKLEEHAKQNDEQLMKYKHEIEEQEKQKGEYENKMKELQEENEELKGKYEKAESEIKKLRSRVAQVEEEQKQMKAKHQELQTQLEEQNRRFTEECEIKQLKHDNEMLRARAEVERIKQELHQERLKQTEKEREQLGKENQKLRRESETQKAEIDRLNNKLSCVCI